LRDDITDEGTGFIEHDSGLFQVNDMDAIALGEDVVFHPGVPPTRLMAEVSSGFEELFDGCCVWQFS
jgi:hypothetical protein